MPLTIRTNHVPRDVLQWWDLTPKEQKEFDYLDTDDAQSGATFARYRGWIYDLSEFLKVPPDLAKWHGYHSDSYFSGIVICYPADSDYERVVMGTYFA